MLLLQCDFWLCNLIAATYDIYLFKRPLFVFQVKDDREVMADFNPDDKTRFVLIFFFVKYDFKRKLIKIYLHFVYSSMVLRLSWLYCSPK